MIVTRIDDNRRIIRECIRSGQVLKSECIGQLRKPGSRRSKQAQQAAASRSNGLLQRIINRALKIGS